VSLIGIKLIDLSLSMRKGLAVVAVMLAITNVTLVVLWPVVFPATAAQVCDMATGTLHEIAPRACANPAAPLAVAGCSDRQPPRLPRELHSSLDRRRFSSATRYAASVHGAMASNDLRAIVKGVRLRMSTSDFQDHQ
jgi:hypothetical protein